jgi:competence protein ComEA
MRRPRRALLLWLALPALGRAAGEAPVEVEVNTARRAALESMPGLGPALVQRLLDGRPFQDWADLMRRVPGVKAGSARKLSAAGLRVAGQPFGSAAGREAG